MEDHHVDVGSKNKKNVDSIFTLFSDLTGEKNENPKHCFALIKSLRGNEFNVGSGSNLEYSVKRLVRGLGSTRLRTQCGCFAALTCILKYDACLVETVLGVSEKEQKPAQGTTKSEMKALITSCVLTCGAIIHSGCFAGQPSEVKEGILRKLIDAGKKKNYLLPVVCQFLIDVINLTDDFTSVWSISKRELFQNLNESGCDVLNLLLVCVKKNPKLANKFIQKNSISPDLLVEMIVRSLMTSSVKYDHPIYENLAWFFCSNTTSPVKIWSKCVNENAKLNSHKDMVLITVFSFIMKNLKEATIVPKLLIPKFLEIIIKVLSLKRTKGPADECNTIAKYALNSMISLLSSEGTSQESKFHSIKKLLFYPGNLKFEMKTGTKCIYTLVSQLTVEFAKKLVDVYKQVISGEIKKVIDEDGTEESWNSKEKQHALHMFTKTLNLPALKKEIDWKLAQVKFIFDIAFLKMYQLPSEVQKCAKDSFYKAIMVQMPSLKELIAFLDELVVHMNENLRNIGGTEVEEYWEKMFSTVEILKKKSNNKLYTAVHVLLIYMGLHLFVDFELAKGGIDELLSCYDRLKETQKKMKNQDDTAPHWTEVTIDLILSLLSRENRVWRHVVSCVFPQVVSQITPTALHQIVDALDPKKNVLGHVNSNESESSSGEESSEDEDEDGVEDEEEDEDEDEDEDEKPNDQLRLAVRNALGHSAAHTDDESVDMDDMNPEEERRLNESLSEAFKQFKSRTETKKKKQTKEEEALTHFRLRVLDLIDIYASNSPSMGGCLDLLLPLFDLLELSIKDYHQRPLQNRVDTILKHISAVKTFSSIENVTQEIIKDVFRAVIGRKETSALVFVEMSPRISDCTAFLVRCSQQISTDEEDIPLVDEYEALLNGFFHSRDHKVPISTFQSVLRMSWKGNFKMVASLFRLLVSSNVRIFKKIKIIELLRLFYKNDRLHQSCDGRSKSELSLIETNFIRNFVAFIAEFEKSESKSSEKMHLSFFSNVIMLVNVIQLSSKRRGVDKTPPWKDLVSKMAETRLVVHNKKTRSQLWNLATAFKIELPNNPEKVKRKRTISEVSDDVRGGIDKEDEEVEEEKEKDGKERKKKKKKLTAEKKKLKKESRELREKISSDGLTGVRFSAFGSVNLPEPETEEEESGKKSPKKRKRKDSDFSIVASE